MADLAIAPPCAYAAHRAHDWTLKDGGGNPVCGICHPPAFEPDQIVRRGERGFEKLVKAWTKQQRETIAKDRAARELAAKRAEEDAARARPY